MQIIQIDYNSPYSIIASNLYVLYLMKGDYEKSLQWLRSAKEIYSNLRQNKKYYDKQEQKNCQQLITLCQSTKKNSHRLLTTLPEQVKNRQFICQELIFACKKMISQLNAEQCFIEANEILKFSQNIGLKLKQEKKRIRFLKKFEKSRLEDFLLTEIFISKSWRTQPKQKLEANSVKRIGKNCRAYILMKCMQINQLQRMGHYEQAQEMLQEILSAIENGQISEKALELLYQLRKFDEIL